MDGSEPGEIVAAAVLSGAPVDLQARQVRYVICAEHGWLWRYIDHISGSFGQRRQLLSPGLGMDIIGGWIGTYYRRVIDGRIP